MNRQMMHWIGCLGIFIVVAGTQPAVTLGQAKLPDLGQTKSFAKTVESLVEEAKKQGSTDPKKVQSRLQSNGIQISEKQAEALEAQIEILAKTDISAEVKKVLAGSQNVDQLLKGISALQNQVKNVKFPEVRTSDGKLLPDLIVESLTTVGGGRDQPPFSLVAVLRNGIKDEQNPRADYPGGGKLIIHQMHETINLDREINFDFSKQGKVIAQMDIPRLKAGQAIRLSASADGGALTAITIPITVDVDPRNNFQQLFKSVKISLTVTEQMMKDWIKPHAIKIHLHETGSFVFINEQKYDLPKLPRKNVDIKIGNLVYYANNINSSNVTFDLKKSNVEWNIVFETDGPEIVGEAPGALSDKLAPDVNADQISVKITIPFHFDEQKKLIKMDDPNVNLRANWLLNITFLPNSIRDSLVKDEWINQPIQSGIKDAFKQHRSKMEKSMNDEIQKALNGGTITRLTPQEDQIVIAAEAKLTQSGSRK